MPTTLHENRPSARIGVVEVQKLEVSCDFVWARGVVEVQKLEVFGDFCGARATVWSRCKNSRCFATFVVRAGPRELSRGSRACSRDRRVAGSMPPWSAAGVARCNLHTATCAEQLAQSKLHSLDCCRGLRLPQQGHVARADACFSFTQ